MQPRQCRIAFGNNIYSGKKAGIAGIVVAIYKTGKFVVIFFFFKSA